MKKALLILTLLAILLISFGCMGKDGLLGRIYLRIQLINFIRYWDNNDGILYNFRQMVYYQCDQGTYSFEYDTADGWEWEGTYTMIADEGEEGQWFVNGEDGADRRYTLTCQSSGPTFAYIEGKDGQPKLVPPSHASEDEIEIIHADGLNRFHIKAIRKARSEETRTKL